MSPVCCVVVRSGLFQLCVRQEQIVDGIPLVGEGRLTSSAERFVGFPIEASVFRPDCIL